MFIQTIRAALLSSSFALKQRSGLFQLALANFQKANRLTLRLAMRLVSAQGELRASRLRKLPVRQ